MRTLLATLLPLLVCTIALAQDNPTDQALIDTLQKLDGRVLKADSPEAKVRSESLRQLREQVNKRDVEQWQKIKTKADWEKFRAEKIAALRRSLGPFPDVPKQVPVVTTRKIAGAGFTVENIIYESRPGLFVTANLYVPADTTKPMPGLLIIHSHHNPKTQGELQDMGMNWARQGCLVLVPDMLGHGERRQHPFSSAKSYPEKFKPDRQDYYFRYNTALQLHLVGESLMSWMVWDLMRGIDVLYQRPNIDKNKIVVFGSVAGGGDPCAVLAALDPRVTAAVPFNFGGPQPETKFPLPQEAELAFNYMGGGSWESTRNLRLSAHDGFLPWVIVGAIAPRGMIYAHEFVWDEKRDPVWARFQKIWGFYDAADKLASMHGRGSVRGTPPESTHCNNIGPEHRKGIYPTLEKWFGLPVLQKEYKDRINASELQCWTADARKTLKPKMVHELVREIALERRSAFKLQVSLPAQQRKAWSKLLGLAGELMPRNEIIAEGQWLGEYRMKKQVLKLIEPQGRLEIALPVLLIYPTATKKPPVVIAIAQDGKAGFLKHRAETIAQILKNGMAVCLPDLRGCGETRPAGEGRGRMSGATSISATELMHGRTVVGTQLQELHLLMKELSSQGFGPLALWGDSFAQPNDPKMNLLVPLDAEKLPRQAEPMGGLLALLGGLFSDDQVKAIYVRGGLVSFRSLLDSPFCYAPHDAVIPGVLVVSDLDVLVAANASRGLRQEAMVDGLNRRVDQKMSSAPAEIAAWLKEQVTKR